MESRGDLRRAAGPVSSAVIATAFFDTNVFVYADDDSNPLKQSAARDLIVRYSRARAGWLSTQVLQEYYNSATKRLKLHHDVVLPRLRKMAAGSVVQLSPDDVIAATELHSRHSIAFWDALIIQAALVAGAAVLFSEDMQDGREIEGVRIHNPFRALAS